MQFPFELKDVLVADPEKVDAVVQSSNRVFLIGKGQGETNAFFFDTKGQQILTAGDQRRRRHPGPRCILKRFVPGSNIHAEMAGKAAVLSGSVRTPLDAKRASDIACQFVAANKSVGTPSVSGGANSSNVGVNSLNPPAPRTSSSRPRLRPPPAAATPSSSSTC